MLFDELLRDGDVDFKRLNCVNIISYELKPGTYFIELSLNGSLRGRVILSVR